FLVRSCKILCSAWLSRRLSPRTTRGEGDRPRFLQSSRPGGGAGVGSLAFHCFNISKRNGQRQPAARSGGGIEIRFQCRKKESLVSPFHDLTPGVEKTLPDQLGVKRDVSSFITPPALASPFSVVSSCGACGAGRTSSGCSSLS